MKKRVRVISNASIIKLTHAVPVVAISASQSLHASAAGGDPIATGLPHLDFKLALDHDEPGGILRGHLTEILGPPGAGKTTLA